eukprot:15455904-Alexandrium_andersonii.AAC.1
MRPAALSPVGAPAPVMPPAEIVERRCLTRVLAEPWCPVCVQAKAADAARRRGTYADDDAGEVTVVGAGYFFLNMDSKLVDFPEAAQSTNLAMIDRRTHTLAAMAVAKKGDCGRYPAQFG